MTVDLKNEISQIKELQLNQKAQSEKKPVSQSKGFAKHDVVTWVLCFFMGVLVCFGLGRFFINDIIQASFDSAVKIEAQKLMAETTKAEK